MGAGGTTDMFDAVVVGAGPAGSATARRLALRGWRVAVLERTRFEAQRIGESLAPVVQEELRELGLWTEFISLAPLPSWGTLSLWGDAEQQMHSHMVNPYGCGWHVDRRAFDRMLAHAAAAAGACLFEGSDLRRSEYRNGCWWLQAACEGAQGDREERTLCARMLIDATGRRAKVARDLGAKRMLFDRLVGIASQWAGVDPVEQSHLLVETAPDGWWYSAPLPGSAQGEAGAMITMLMTDADLCGRLRLGGADRWQAVLHSTQATHQRLGSARRVSAPKVHCAHSQRLRRDAASDAGPWLAVGDAALSVDPVSGSGVVRALRTARAAADTVHGLLTDPPAWRDAVAAYESARDDECSSFLVERAQYYAAEQRFDSPFWQRRAAVMAPKAL